MKALSTQQIQKCTFQILKYFKDVCTQNNLRYYLCYGTLIGAVRHQGFIPWDDDVDVHMPREDYLKMVGYLSDNPHPYFKLVSKETDLKFTAPLPKIIDTRTKVTQHYGYIEKVPLGIYIDIFILDGAGHTLAEGLDTYDQSFILYRHWLHADFKMFLPGQRRSVSFLRWVYHIPEKVFGIRYWLDKLDRFCEKRPFDDYEYVGAFNAGTPEASRNIWKREWFGAGKDVVFNGEVFTGPENYDAVLRPEYGDYMILPPPDKQVSNHCYDLEILDVTILDEL